MRNPDCASMRIACLLILAGVAAAAPRLGRDRMQIFHIEANGQPKVQYGARSIKVQLTGTIPGELKGKNFKVRLFRGAKQYIRRYAGAKLEDCVRLTGSQRFVARIDAANQLVVNTGLLHEEFLAWDGPRYRDQVWSLIAEIGDVGDDGGIWIEGSSLDAYISSALEVLIESTGAPRREVVAAPYYQRTGATAYSSAVASPAIVLYGRPVCYAAQFATSTKGTTALLIARVQDCAAPPI